MSKEKQKKCVINFSRRKVLERGTSD